MAKGIIYLMSTAVDGLIKIGKTDNFENRMRELERHGYCNVSSLKREFAIELENYHEKESLLQNIFSKSRISTTELFSVDIDLAKQLLSSFDGKIIYPKQSKAEIFATATDSVEEKTLLNRHYFKEFKFHSSLTNKTYYTKVNDAGTLSIFDAETNTEIVNNSKPSKKQIVLQATKDLNIPSSKDDTLYQLVHKLQKLLTK